MNSMKFLVVLIFGLVVFYSSGSSSAADPTVLEILQGNFTGFYDYVSKWPDLVALLSRADADVTVFAPTNLAVNSTNFPENVTQLNLLQYHIVYNQYTHVNLTDELPLPTYFLSPFLNNGSQVVIVNKVAGWTTINHVANITLPDLVATNGRVHGINAVLFPPTNNVYNTLAANSTYSTVQSLLSRVSTPINNNTITFLAPTNDAFSGVSREIINYLVSNETTANADLTNILNYHVLSGLYYAYYIPLGNTSVVTESNNQTLDIFKPSNWPNSSIIVNNNARAVQYDLLTANGVIHGIDNVLIPSNFQFTTEKLLIGLGASTFLGLVEHFQTYDLLNDSVPHTLFVPTNAAFNGANVTRSGLYYHGANQSLDLNPGYGYNLVDSLLALNTLGGQDQKLKLTSTNSSVFVNGLNITYGGRSYTGNPVYLIDSTLTLPLDVSSVLSSDNYTTLSNALVQAGVSVNLTSDSSLTVFAPTEEAFGQLPPGTLGYLLLNNSGSSDTLRTILDNHVVRANTVYYSTVIPVGTTTVPTLAYNGSVVVTKTANGMVTVNNANVTFPDLLAANGVVHGVDRVLVPASVTFTLANILEGLPDYSTLLNYLNMTGLLNSFATDGSLTIFAPDNDAFAMVEDRDALESNDTLLRHVLLTHILYTSVPQLNVSSRFGVEGNQTIVVTDDNFIELEDPSGKRVGSADVILHSSARNGYLYGINRVLGVPQESSSGGLKAWQIALIVVGGVIVGLVLLLIVIGVVYFVFLKPRTGYRKIN